MSNRETQQYNSDVTLGEEYTDEITGFSGVATAISFFYGGTQRVLLEAKKMDGNGTTAEWFDIERVAD